MSKITIHIDGGSRGNPGKAAFGVVISDTGNGVVKKYSESIGVATNNEAEYYGLIFALKKSKSLFGKEKIKKTRVEIYSDSKLIVNQMKGKFKILDAKIQKLFLIAWNISIDFSDLEFFFIPREKNKEADRLVNEQLDSETLTLPF